MPQSLVAVVMGSSSDWETMKHAADVLERFNVPHERHIVSAHRTPVWMAEFASSAESRGLEVIIAGAGGAAHLPGMVAAQTLLPVLGVPVETHALHGMDSLLSIVQMPAGIPVGTLAIGRAGATNAALLAVAILATTRPALRERLRQFRAEQTDRVRQDTLPGATRSCRARRSACSAAASWAVCSPSPPAAWATASTPTRRRRTRPPARWPTARSSRPTTTWTRCAPSRTAWT
jgi:5-(carboxyamino)imidazole ribonucleotide mutase